METKPSVVIGVPCPNSSMMNAKTANAIGCTIIYSEGIVTDYLIRISCDIVANRTWLVKQAIERGATHILFVDTDMYFPAYALTRLLEHDKDIVGVEYNKRQFPLELAIAPSASNPVLLERSDTEIYKQMAVGTGLLLIKLSVFDKIKDEVWFSFGRDSNGETTVGEDVWFCNTARDAGFDIWVDPTLNVKHLGEYAY